MSDVPPRVSLRFPRSARIVRGGDYQRIIKHGVRITDGVLVIWAVANGLPHARLGLVVGRKHGNAPRRNRVKRLIREAFRLSRHNLPPGIDLVCAPAGSAETLETRPLTLQCCRESLEALATKAARRTPARPDGSVST
ncbi:Ribonuclease P protein component [Phycisphaerae bacterium RAS1]|nr:Ribonuclease P protein component [Phycisphaerae bacterium RAS1]